MHGAAGRHEMHAIQQRLFLAFHGQSQMAMVNGIEGAAEDPDNLGPRRWRQ
jgi:hypothetical protein